MGFGISRKHERVPDLSRYDYHYHNKQQHDHGINNNNISPSERARRHNPYNYAQTQQRSYSLTNDVAFKHSSSNIRVPFSNAHSTDINNHSRTYSLRSPSMQHTQNPIPHYNSQQQFHSSPRYSQGPPQPPLHHYSSQQQLHNMNSQQQLRSMNSQQRLQHYPISSQQQPSNDRTNSITIETTEFKDANGRTKKVTKKTITRLDDVDYIDNPNNNDIIYEDDAEFNDDFNQQYIIEDHNDINGEYILEEEDVDGDQYILEDELIDNDQNHLIDDEYIIEEEDDDDDLVDEDDAEGEYEYEQDEHGNIYRIEKNPKNNTVLVDQHGRIIKNSHINRKKQQHYENENVLFDKHGRIIKTNNNIKHTNHNKQRNRNIRQKKEDNIMVDENGRIFKNPQNLVVDQDGNYYIEEETDDDDEVVEYEEEEEEEIDDDEMYLEADEEDDDEDDEYIQYYDPKTRKTVIKKKIKKNKPLPKQRTPTLNRKRSVIHQTPKKPEKKYVEINNKLYLVQESDEDEEKDEGDLTEEDEQEYQYVDSEGNIISPNRINKQKKPAIVKGRSNSIVNNPSKKKTTSSNNKGRTNSITQTPSKKKLTVSKEEMYAKALEIATKKVYHLDDDDDEIDDQYQDELHRRNKSVSTKSPSSQSITPKKSMESMNSNHLHSITKHKNRKPLSDEEMYRKALKVAQKKHNLPDSVFDPSPYGAQPTRSNPAPHMPKSRPKSHSQSQGQGQKLPRQSIQQSEESIFDSNTNHIGNDNLSANTPLSSNTGSIPPPHQLKMDYQQKNSRHYPQATSSNLGPQQQQQQQPGGMGTTLRQQPQQPSSRPRKKKGFFSKLFS